MSIARIGVSPSPIETTSQMNVLVDLKKALKNDLPSFLKAMTYHSIPWEKMASEKFLGHTFLHLAIIERQDAIAKFLLDLGASPTQLAGTDPWEYDPSHLLFEKEKCTDAFTLAVHHRRTAVLQDMFRRGHRPDLSKAFLDTITPSPYLEGFEAFLEADPAFADCVYSYRTSRRELVSLHPLNVAMKQALLDETWKNLKSNTIYCKMIAHLLQLQTNVNFEQEKFALSPSTGHVKHYLSKPLDLLADFVNDAEDIEDEVAKCQALGYARTLYKLLNEKGARLTSEFELEARNSKLSVQKRINPAEVFNDRKTAIESLNIFTINTNPSIEKEKERLCQLSKSLK